MTAAYRAKTMKAALKRHARWLCFGGLVGGLFSATSFGLYRLLPLEQLMLDLELMLALVYGQAFKIICTAYQVDKSTPEPLQFPRCLFTGPEKYRTAGSWMLVVGLVFIVPGAAFEKLLSSEVWGWPLGHLGVGFIGFIADDLFVIVPLFVAHKLREFSENKLGVPPNGAFKPQPKKNLPSTLRPQDRGRTADQGDSYEQSRRDAPRP